MVKRIVHSMRIAVQAAVMGFDRSYKEGEEIDSILGYVDCLTELPNRRAFERDKDLLGEKHAMVMIDIDNFKNINNMYGHVFGDKVLKRLAAILSETVLPLGRVYRFAGDEFICIVPRKDVMLICSTIRSNVRKEDTFTISQGVFMNLDQGITSEAFMQADWAMYQSKLQGKDRITMVTPELAGAI